MDHMEMVDKLREKANVSYEEAKTALEKSEWDLLDALVYLENQGKMGAEKTETYTTKKEPRPQADEAQDVRGAFTRLFSFIAELINKGNRISMEVRRHQKLVLTIPLTVLILLLIFVFWWVLPIMVVGLFFGARYSFKGPGIADTVNRAMDKAADTAQSIKSGIKNNEKHDSSAE